MDKNDPAFELSFVSPRYWPTWMLLFVFFLIHLLPARIVDSIGNRLGRIAARKNKKRYEIARKNISLCFPEKTPNEVNQMVVAHFCAQMRSMLHYGLIWWSSDKKLKSRIETEGFEYIDACRTSGRNTIILTCHTVGLEFSVASVTMSYTSSGPYKSMRNPVINWMVAKGRRRYNAQVFTRDEGLRPLIRDTRDGRALIYLADEDLGAERCVFAPFFNVQKATVPVLGRLAKSCNAAVFLCFSCYDVKTARYRVCVLPELESFPHETEKQDATAMNQALESAVLNCPEQYFWTLRLFQTRPAGEPSVYD